MSNDQNDKIDPNLKHVSFSELKEWKECSFRHKLDYIQGLDPEENSPVLEFGKAIHASCEHFLRTREMDLNIAVNWLMEAWENPDNQKWEKFQTENIEIFLDEIPKILNEIPAFMEREFPDWEFVDAEHRLYEDVVGKSYKFKGYIDGIISCKNSRGKKIYWIIDWKTSIRFWSIFKLRDESLKQQLYLYKNFWANKNKIDIKQIQCGFVILKRQAKLGAHCQLIKVSAGEVVIQRSLKLINNMISSVERGVAIKNRENCRFCPFNETEFCKHEVK